MFKQIDYTMVIVSAWRGRLSSTATNSREGGNKTRRLH